MRPSIPVVVATTGVLTLGIALWLRYQFIVTDSDNLGDLGHEILLSILLRPLSFFVDRPWLALLPATLFVSIWFWLHSALRGSHRWVQGILWAAALAWLFYAVYEWRMDQWERTVTAPIRLDMLLVAPV